MKTREVLAMGAAVAAAFGLGVWMRPEAAGDMPTSVDPRGAGRAVAEGATTEIRRPIITFVDPTTRRVTPVLSGPGRIDAMEAQAMGVSPEEMFAAQQRDEEWAPIVERFYLDEYGRYLRAALGELSELRAVCKESVCEISFQVPVDDEERAYRRQQYMPTGSLWKPFSRAADDDALITVGMLVTLGDEVRNPADLARFYAHHREERFPPGRDIERIIAEWERLDEQ